MVAVYGGSHRNPLVTREAGDLVVGVGLHGVFPAAASPPGAGEAGGVDDRRQMVFVDARTLFRVR